LILLVLGLGTVAISAAVGTLAGGGLGGTELKVAGFVVSGLLNMGLFWAVFRLFTSETVPTRQLWLGIVLAAIGWTVLQVLGGVYVARIVNRASKTYGALAIVIGLMSWLYLGAQMLLYAAEANAVRARRLGPRSLMQPVTADVRRCGRSAPRSGAGGGTVRSSCEAELQGNTVAAMRRLIMQVRAGFLGAATAAALALVVAGCGGGSDSSTSSSGSSSGGSEGGTATVLMGTAPDYLDTQLGYTTQSAEPDWITYTPLVTYRHANGTSGGELIPGLATALPRSRATVHLHLTLRRGLVL
jgi:hypothetical protein